MSTQTELSLKEIKQEQSHANLGKVSKDNFSELVRYINLMRARIDILENADSVSTATSQQIANTIRSNMLLVANINFTHVDGVTVTQTNGISVSRSNKSFIIQTPDSVPILLHALRDATTKQFAIGYNVSMDGSNQFIITFNPFIKENYELILFG